MILLAKRSAQHKRHRSTQGAATGRREARVDLAWPLIACYGPQPDVWHASGTGSVLVVRQRPDGKEALTFGTLSLSEGGVSLLASKLDADPGSHLDLATQLRKLSQVPAAAAMPPELVADYLYGACALFYSGVPDSRWPDEVWQALSILPSPLGKAVTWRNRLVGPGGLTPEGLVRILKTNHHTDQEPEGKDPLVLTTVRVALPSGSGRKVMQDLLAREEPPLFVSLGARAGATVLEWRRVFEGGPRVAPGQKAGVVFGDPSDADQITLRILTGDGQQTMGQIAIAGDTAEIECMTLSRASVLVGALEEAAASPLVIESADWRDVLSEIGRR